MICFFLSVLSCFCFTFISYLLFGSPSFLFFFFLFWFLGISIRCISFLLVVNQILLQLISIGIDWEKWWQYEYKYYYWLLSTKLCLFSLWLAWLGGPFIRVVWCGNGNRKRAVALPFNIEYFAYALCINDRNLLIILLNWLNETVLCVNRMENEFFTFWEKRSWFNFISSYLLEYQSN